MNLRPPALFFACLLAACAAKPEFGGEGAACESNSDCGRELSCLDGTCTAAEATDAGHDAAEEPSDTDSVPDTSSPDAAPDTAPDLGPCDGTCADPVPVCDTTTDTCVACLATTDCATGVCDPTTNACVACLVDEDCTDAVCDTATNTCVGCLADSDCPDPTASACDTATNTCMGCADSTQCAHLTDTTICDADATTCVECLDDDDTTRAACNGNSCDPALNTCTQTPVTSLAACDYCVADSECPTDFRCIPMEFQGAPRNAGVGGYCLRTLASGACAAPYQTGIDRQSVNNVAAETYCGISEGQTTCEAVRDLVDNNNCTVAEDCGAAGLADARCESILGNLKCTYNCGASSQCPSGFICGPTTNFCGGT